MKLLTSTHQSQRVQLIRTIDDDQFDILVEIVYNILHGICSLTKKEEEMLKKHKTQLRKLIEKKTTKIVKKDILVSIQQIIPSLLSPLLRYLSNIGK